MTVQVCTVLKTRWVTPRPADGVEVRAAQRAARTEEGAEGPVSQPEEVTSCSGQRAAHIPGLIQNLSWQPGRCPPVSVVSTMPRELCPGQPST